MLPTITATATGYDSTPTATVRGSTLETFTPDEDATLRAMTTNIAYKNRWKAIAIKMNAQFGTKRTAASLRSHVYRAQKNATKIGKNRCSKCGMMKIGHKCPSRIEGDQTKRTCPNVQPQPAPERYETRQTWAQPVIWDSVGTDNAPTVVAVVGGDADASPPTTPASPREAGLKCLVDAATDDCVRVVAPNVVDIRGFAVSTLIDAPTSMTAMCYKFMVGLLDADGRYTDATTGETYWIHAIDHPDMGVGAKYVAAVKANRRPR